MYPNHHNDALFSHPKLISLLCISWENDTLRDGKVSWLFANTALGAFIILLVGCSAACVTATQSSNRTLNMRPRYSAAYWTRDDIAPIKGAKDFWAKSININLLGVFTVSFDMNDV